eukprot:7516797-Pyramimonas_sp.AAC.1
MSSRDGMRSTGSKDHVYKSLPRPASADVGAPEASASKTETCVLVGVLLVVTNTVCTNTWASNKQRNGDFCVSSHGNYLLSRLKEPDKQLTVLEDGLVYLLREYGSEPLRFLTLSLDGRTGLSSRQLYHAAHKIPPGRSTYARAKHLQLVDKDLPGAEKLLRE